jgi:hypothetical protein
VQIPETSARVDNIPEKRQHTAQSLDSSVGIAAKLSTRLLRNQDYNTFSGKIFSVLYKVQTGLCGLVVRVLGYRSGGPGSIPGTTMKKK